METIKVSVDVNVNLSEDVKKFLAALLAPKCNCSPVAMYAVDNFDPTQDSFEEHAAPAPAAPAPVPAAPAPAPAASKEIDIEDLRKLVKEKANMHREKIKEQLNKFGTSSVTGLDPSKYEEMYNFLINL